MTFCTRYHIFVLQKSFKNTDFSRYKLLIETEQIWWNIFLKFFKVTNVEKMSK